MFVATLVLTRMTAGQTIITVSHALEVVGRYAARYWLHVTTASQSNAPRLVKHNNNMSSDKKDFAPGAATSRTRTNSTNLVVIALLLAHLLHSKPEVYYILHCRQHFS